VLEKQSPFGVDLVLEKQSPFGVDLVLKKQSPLRSRVEDLFFLTHII
jgi:hypothetical protein